MTCGADWWDEQTPDPPDDDGEYDDIDPGHTPTPRRPPTTDLPDIADYQPTT